MEVHIKYPNTESPTGTHYVVARNGLHLNMETDWIKAVVPVKEFKALEPVQPGATLLLPPIPAEVFIQIYAFFRAVFLRHGTEAAVLLHYGHGQGWAFTVPQQKVSRAYVKYEMVQRLEGYRCVGTMHSHADMRASHSHTDVRDEADFDGIHVTIGNLEQYPKFSMEAEIVVRGTRFPLPIEQIEGVIAPQAPAKKEPSFFMGGYRPPLYSFTATELERPVLEEWMAQVQTTEHAWPMIPIAARPPVQKEGVLKEILPPVPATPPDIPAVQTPPPIIDTPVPTVPQAEIKPNVLPPRKGWSFWSWLFSLIKPKE